MTGSRARRVSVPSFDALAWLHSFSDSERSGIPAGGATSWNLRRTRALLDLDGAPDRGMAVVLVAGTKGKGSTSAMLASILAAAGVRAGLYTQPHLQRYEERVRVDGVAISPAGLRRAASRMRDLVGRLAEREPDIGTPTTFEITTALALSHFAAEGCAAAVVEVGIGGRLDATNVLDPAVSLITPISHDHMAILGRTLPAIAREKSGIARSDRPLLTAVQPRAAARAIEAASRRIGAALRVIGPDALPRRIEPGLAGVHQRQNAALARAAALALRESGIKVSERAIATGLSRARWPGRLEVLQPGCSHPTTVIDGAHNDGSAKALAEAVRTRYGDRPLHLVLGVLRDKDAPAVLRPLLPLADRVWTCTPPGGRGLPARRLATVVAELSGKRATALADPGKAIAAARRADPAAVVCIAGSLALAGAARKALGLPWPRRLWSA